MKKIIIIGLVVLLMVSLVSATWIQQISEQTLLNLNRQQIINNLNIQCDNPYVNYEDGEIIYPCERNTIVKDNGEYWIKTHSFYPKLDYRLVKYCLNNYQPIECKNFLVNNPNRENVTINGQEYTISPVQHQIIEEAIETIEHIEQLQQSIIDENLLNLIQQQGGVTIPVIS